jgi:hypothetical protein
MDSSGRLHMPLSNGKEFVGETFEETGMAKEANRHERRKLEAEFVKAKKAAFAQLSKAK